MITLASQGLTADEIAARRREQRNRAGRVYYSRNVGSCLLKGKKWKAEHPEAVAAASTARSLARATARQTADWFLTRPVKGLLSQARRRAKVKQIPFALVAADLLPLPTHCPVLGMKLNYGPGRGRKLYENGAAASLDRIHNNLGYVKGNVIVVSLRANLLKGQATIEELRKIADFYGRLP